MAIKIEVFAVRPESAADYGGPKCHYRFAAEFALDGDPDAACLAAGACARALGPMYAGDKMKVVAYVNGHRFAQFIGVIPRIGGLPEELACVLESGKPGRGEWKWNAQSIMGRPRSDLWAYEWAKAGEPCA